MWKLLNIIGKRERKQFGYTARSSKSDNDQDEDSFDDRCDHGAPFYRRIPSFTPRGVRNVEVRTDGVDRCASDGESVMSIGAEGLQKHRGAGEQVSAFVRKHRQKIKPLVDRDAPEFQATGQFNVRKRGTEAMHMFNDFYHVLIHMPVLKLIFFFWVIYLVSFLGFASLWLHVSEECNVGLKTWIEAICFSIETQMNIGYGADDPTFDHCNEVLLVMPVQSLFGVILDCTMLGMIFQHFAGGQSRTCTVVFSDTAVLEINNDNVDIAFRLAEMSSRPLLQVTMQVYVVQHIEDSSKPGGVGIEIFAVELQEPKTDAINGVIFAGLPTKVRHRIDRFSPFSPQHQELNPDRDPKPDEIRRYLRHSHYLELVVLVGGTEDSTASSVEARHSYTLDDMYWDRTFAPCVSVDEYGWHSVDYEALHETVPYSWNLVSNTDHRVRLAGTARPETVCESPTNLSSAFTF